MADAVLSPARRLDHGLLWALMAVGLLTLLPVTMGWVHVGTLLMPAAGALAAYGLSRQEDPVDRRTFMLLWALSMSVRWVLLIVFVLAQRSAGLVLLGPDGVQYLGRSVELAASGLQLGVSPIAHYGTFDVGPYYVFAALIRLFGNSLLVLQVGNAAMSALIAPLGYACARRLLPAGAGFVGLALACYPTSALHAVVDLWKDPAVMTATMLAVWALVHVLRETTRGWRLVLLTGVATVALAFLHVSRFYTLLFLLVGLGVSAVWLLLAGGGLRLPRHGVRAAGVAFLLAECALLPLGWPPTPVQFAETARGVLGAQEDPPVRATAPARIERDTVRPREDVRPDLSASLRFAERRPDPAGAADSRAETTSPPPPRAQPRTLRVETEEYRTLPTAVNVQGRLAGLVRKTLGPFIWVLPPDVSVRTLLAGDYLLYPGMLFWYALWPCMLLGLVVTGVRLVKGETSVMLGGVAVYTAAYFALYLTVNLSYRQRDALFPFLLWFAVIGVTLVKRQALLRWAYGLYWLALVALAAAHLLVRTQVA